MNGEPSRRIRHSAFAFELAETVRSKSAIFVAYLEAIGRTASEAALRQAIAVLDGRLAKIGGVREVLVARLVQIGAERPMHKCERALEIIAKGVYAEFDVPRPSRGARLENVRGDVLPRHVTLLLARELTNYSSVKIGEHFRCNHATVLYACKRASELEITALRATIIEALRDASDFQHLRLPA